LSDISNYRAITLSNSITKVLEFVFLDHVNDKMTTIDSQFGFKAGLSTSLCTYSFKQTVAYYTGRHVFVCFADFSKAFDKVNYWKLFKQLLDNGLSHLILSLLAYWYSHQRVCVLWRDTLSSSFVIGNGTKQGGVLSPCPCPSLSLWLIGTVRAEPETVISRAWVQSPDPANKLFQDYWRACFEINFSDRQEGLTVSSIICDR